MTLWRGSTRIEQVATGLGRDDLIRDRRCRAHAGRDPISSLLGGVSSFQKAVRCRNAFVPVKNDAGPGLSK
jgi:hypothetical protein